MGLGMLEKTMGGMFGMISENRANSRDRANAQQQYENQRKLNQQGHDLQMDMWNKTNYKAQLEHMKSAGLNPALMYGMGGSGGTTTGSQGGGSAVKANAQKQMAIEGLMAGAQTELLKAQVENVEADTQNKIDENPNINKKGNLLDAQTQEKLTEIDKKLGEIANLKVDNKIKQEQVLKVKQEVKTLLSTELLNNAKVSLTNEQKKSVKEMVEVAWANSGIMQQNADANMSNAEQMIEANVIRRLELDLKRELGTMNIDTDQKIAMIQSLTSILTALLGGLSRGIPTTNTTRMR
jgi:hypothetical protein